MRSETPGLRRNCVTKLAPREIIFRLRSLKSDNMGREFSSSKFQIRNTENVPAIDSTIASIACAGDHVKVAFLLLQDELGDELGVVAQVRVHDNDEVARGVLDPVHIGCTETQFLGSRTQNWETWCVKISIQRT